MKKIYIDRERQEEVVCDTADALFNELQPVLVAMPELARRLADALGRAMGAAFDKHFTEEE